MAKKKRRAKSNKQTTITGQTKRVSRREKRLLAAKKAKQQQMMRIAGIAGIFIILFAVFAYFRQINKPEADPLAALRESSPDAAVATQLGSAEFEETTGISLENIRGNPNAPVSIVEYGDFG